MDIDQKKLTIVLIHGSGLSHIVWSLHEQFYTSLGYNVLSLDLPGHGNSSGPSLKSIEEISDWIKSLINKIIKAGKKYSITAGIHSVSPDPKDAIKFKKNGFKFLSISLDSIFLSNKAKSTLDEIKKK